MRTMPNTFVFIALVVFASACTTTNEGDNAGMSAVSGEEIVPGLTKPIMPLSEDARQFLSPQEICDTLTPEDMAPLTDGEVTDKPTPTTDLGLPGCRWPVENGWGWLELSVFEPVSVDALITISEEQYQVGNSTGYQTFPDAVYSCRGIVVSPGAPDGYVLGVALDKVIGTTPANPDLCELAIPQTVKVLERLGW
ncbi:UNVERIFIED_CONTAM: hypothetical protein DES50_11449 [Williamsia faeni]